MRLRGRAPLLIAAGAMSIFIAWHGAPVSAQAPAGATNAVLSYVDAAGGHVSLNRHWHGAGGQDVQVYPYVPYFWNSCLPGDGAIMILLTSPVGYPPPGLKSAEAYTSQYLGAVGQQVASGLASAPQARGDIQLQRIIAGMTVPGDPAYEALKVALGSVNTLSNYEDYGYATFMFIKWEWRWPFPGCYPTVMTVPEGYGVPFVSRARPTERVDAAWPFSFPAGLAARERY